MERPTVQLDKNSQERRAARTKLLFIVLLVGLAVLAGLIAFFRMPSFQVAGVSVQGTKASDPEQVVQSVQAYLSGNRLFVIPRSNVLLISKSGIEKFVLGQMPNLSSASVAFSNRTSLVVTVSEKKPDYVWCTNENACYFVDENGVVFSDAPLFSDGVYVMLKGGGIPADHPIRGIFINRDSFEGIKSTVESLRLSGANVLGVELRDNGDVAYRIGSLAGSMTSSSAAILSVRDADPQALVQSLGLILEDSAFSESLKSKGASLEYLDLRFPSKIYYKFSAN